MIMITSFAFIKQGEPNNISAEQLYKQTIFQQDSKSLWLLWNVWHGHGKWSVLTRQVASITTKGGKDVFHWDQCRSCTLGMNPVNSNKLKKNSMLNNSHKTSQYKKSVSLCWARIKWFLTKINIKEYVQKNETSITGIVHTKNWHHFLTLVFF